MPFLDDLVLCLDRGVRALPSAGFSSTCVLHLLSHWAPVVALAVLLLCLGSLVLTVPPLSTPLTAAVDTWVVSHCSPNLQTCREAEETGVLLLLLWVPRLKGPWLFPDLPAWLHGLTCCQVLGGALTVFTLLLPAWGRSGGLGPSFWALACPPPSCPATQSLLPPRSALPGTFLAE